MDYNAVERAKRAGAAGLSLVVVIPVAAVDAAEVVMIGVFVLAELVVLARWMMSKKLQILNTPCVQQINFSGTSMLILPIIIMQK